MYPAYQIKEFLEKENRPVSVMELIQKTGVDRDEIAKNETRGQIISMFKATDKAVPGDLSRYGGPGTVANVKTIMEYMAQNPDRTIWSLELANVFELRDSEVRLVMGVLEQFGVVIPFFISNSPISCEVCFHRQGCKMNEPAERCHRFKKDYRHAGQSTLYIAVVYKPQ